MAAAAHARRARTHIALDPYMFSHIVRAVIRAAPMVTLFARPDIALGQSNAVSDSLVARALAMNPSIRVAEARLAAARARIGPAGAWPDPMLMAGIQNFPLSASNASAGMSSGTEPMTMKMLGVSQTIPYPGKTSLASRVARAEAEGAEARSAMARREVRREVLDAYYDLVTARMLLGIVERQRQLAEGILPATEARYVAGGGAQSDVLKARTELSLLVQERNTAVQEERAALARLNAVLDQASTTSITADSLRQQLVSIPALPPLDSIEALATRTNPRLLERRAVIAMQGAQSELARRAYLPDFDVSLQYGQRDRLPDMITATISVPIPVQRGRKQSAEARAARFDLNAAEAELRAEENAIRSDVARVYSVIERHRANLALLDRAILPQARATFASASATYQSGRSELLEVLDALRAVFAIETMRVRTLADYAKSLAELETLVGQEVTR